MRARASQSWGRSLARSLRFRQNYSTTSAFRWRSMSSSNLQRLRVSADLCKKSKTSLDHIAWASSKTTLTSILRIAVRSVSFSSVSHSSNIYGTSSATSVPTSFVSTSPRLQHTIRVRRRYWNSWKTQVNCKKQSTSKCSHEHKFNNHLNQALRCSITCSTGAWISTLRD